VTGSAGTHRRKRHKGPRPRLCAICHVPASLAIVWDRRASRLGRDGSVVRWTAQHTLYARPAHARAVEERAA